MVSHEKCFGGDHSNSFPAAFIIPSYSELTDPGSTRMCRPEIISGIDPALVATTGMSSAQASAVANPKPSVSEGITTQLTSRMALKRSCRVSNGGKMFILA